MKKLLVVVDMVNGFVNQGALADKKIDKITPVIVDLVKKAIAKNVPIVAFKDTHIENDIEFETYPPHCIRGTSECELIPQLKGFESKMISIEKSTTNGFETKEFRQIAKNNNFEEIVIVGCCTDICVEALAKSLVAYNRHKGRKTKITVVQNGVYTFDAPGHHAETQHKKALERMKKLGVNIVMSKTHAKETTQE